MRAKEPERKLAFGGSGIPTEDRFARRLAKE
jgi:hypothetical protein